jgi:very-short-patch-repair endonuclease
VPWRQLHTLIVRVCSPKVAIAIHGHEGPELTWGGVAKTPPKGHKRPARVRLAQPKGHKGRPLTTAVVLSEPVGEPIAMPRSVPVALRNKPFRLAEARTLGVTRGQLRAARCGRLGSGMYHWVGLKEGPQLTLTAVAHRLPRGAAFSGGTAAWLHGLDVEPCDPIEVTIPEPGGGSRVAGASVRRAALAAGENVLRRRLPATSALRTAVDLGGRNPLNEAVVSVDLFLHAQLVSLEDLLSHIACHSGAWGIARLRRVVDLAEPKSESAMESRLRMVLVTAGLPKPEVQTDVHDNRGHFLGRPDLLYRQPRLAIEYDGGTHRDRMVEDNRRQNGLVGAGYRLLRFTASDVYNAPETVVMQERHGLAGK